MRQGYRTKSWTTKKGKHRSGSPWNTGHIYRLLGNRLYSGRGGPQGEGLSWRARGHRLQGTVVTKVQEVLSENIRAKQTKARTKIISPLRGGGSLRPL